MAAAVVLNFFQAIYVEPIPFASWTPFAMYGAVIPNAKYQKYERLCYEDMTGDNPCYLMTGGAKDYWIKNRFSNWEIAIQWVNFPIAMVFSIIWSALSDRQGRQQPMLLGLTSVQWSIMGWALVLTTSWNAPIALKIPATIVTAIFGENTLQMTASQSFMADTIWDKEFLTMRLTFLTVLRALAQSVGFFLVILFPDLTFNQWILMCVCMVTAGFIYVLLRIPQVPPKEFSSRDRASSVAPSIAASEQIEMRENRAVSMSSTIPPDAPFSLKTGLVTTLKTFRDTWRAFKKPRSGHLRFIVCAIALLQFITGMLPSEVSGGGTILSTYVIGKPFGWSNQDIAKFNNIALVSSMVGTLGGIWFFKKIIPLRDTTLILIGMVSSTLCNIPVAIADKENNEWMIMYLANALAILGGLQVPTMISYIAKIVPQHELGRIYVAFSTVGFVSGLIYGSLFLKIYVWSITGCKYDEHLNPSPDSGFCVKGLVWYIAIGLNIFCVFMMGYVHILSVREKVEEVIPARLDNKDISGI